MTEKELEDAVKRILAHKLGYVCVDEMPFKVKVENDYYYCDFYVDVYEFHYHIRFPSEVIGQSYLPDDDMVFQHIWRGLKRDWPNLIISHAQKCLKIAEKLLKR